jgi:hypothetical protein
MLIAPFDPLHAAALSFGRRQRCCGCGKGGLWRKQEEPVASAVPVMLFVAAVLHDCGPRLRDEEVRVRILVETYEGHRGMRMPRRFQLGRSRVEVAETLDQWYGPDYRYIKVKARDETLYILRVHEVHDLWELTLFKSPRAQTISPVRFGRQCH